MWKSLRAARRAFPFALLACNLLQIVPSLGADEEASLPLSQVHRQLIVKRWHGKVADAGNKPPAAVPTAVRVDGTILRMPSPGYAAHREPDDIGAARGAGLVVRGPSLFTEQKR